MQRQEKNKGQKNENDPKSKNNYRSSINDRR